MIFREKMELRDERLKFGKLKFQLLLALAKKKGPETSQSTDTTNKNTILSREELWSFLM